MDNVREKIEAACDVLKESLVRKNNGYGSSVFQENVFFPSLDASVLFSTRISDKIQRIKNLKKSLDAELETEKKEALRNSLLDALTDAAGYFVLWSIYERK